ncbi:MAG: AlkZ family DNA glycosylase, partial [Spirochaetales bacterium]|nr:AlkZ family DNA glycosylase [Spirochaetales bacterium]
MESDDEIVRFIRKIGCIQYDPLSKTARNADLVLQSRCRNCSEDTLYRLLYEQRVLVDGWDKNMSIWAATDWPYFARRRDRYLNRYSKRSGEFEPVKSDIINLIKKNGYISSKDVHGNKKVQWAWAPTDIGRAVLESMFHCGELLIHHRDGARKYYGLTTELLPGAMANEIDPNKTVEDYHEWLVKRRIGAVGLLWNKSGDAWLGTNLTKDERSQSFGRLLEKEEIVEVKIADSKEIFYMPKAEARLLHVDNQCGEASVIAPLDNLMWDRKLISAIFNFDYRWEVYTPSQARKFGYYVLPVLAGETFVARCEPIVDRKNNELVIRNWWWEDNVRIS